MKVKYIGEADRLSKGIYLVPGMEYEVSKEVAEYLIKTFKDIILVEVEVKLEEKPDGLQTKKAQNKTR